MPSLNINRMIVEFVISMSVGTTIIRFLLQLQESNVKKDEENKKMTDDLTACCDNRKAVVDCYRKYPNEPMRCAKEVLAFTQCVDFKRSVLMENRG